jgi:predicted Zn-dependent protease
MAVTMPSALRDPTIKSTYRLPTSLLESALEQGSDPRTVETYAKQAEKIARSSKQRGIRGIAARFLARDVKLPTLRKKIALEAQTQPALEVIRQAREELAQQTAANISRKRGNVSLLSSPTGGSGFLQGYFR